VLELFAIRYPGTYEPPLGENNWPCKKIPVLQLCAIDYRDQDQRMEVLIWLSIVHSLDRSVVCTTRHRQRCGTQPEARSSMRRGLSSNRDAAEVPTVLASRRAVDHEVTPDHLLK
jgi:hypothetical protein